MAEVPALSSQQIEEGTGEILDDAVSWPVLRCSTSHIFLQATDKYFFQSGFSGGPGRGSCSSLATNPRGNC